MLVLKRRYGEKIYIGDRIVITILEASGGVCRLGFEAPAEIPINREELLSESARKQIQKAANLKSQDIKPPHITPLDDGQVTEIG